MTRASLAQSIRQSMDRLPANHYGRDRARHHIELLESDCPITPSTMTAIRQNADWYVDYLERMNRSIAT
jgi:hypothetical protein